MPTMRLGHMFSRVSSSSFLSGIIGWYYVHRRFSFLKHDNLMAHHVKAFWIGHHIVCACLIALTDALMFAMLAFCWQRAWRHCVFRDEMMTESSMRVVPPLSHMFVSGNPEWVFYYPEWVFYCWYCPGTRVFANSSLPDCQVIADLWSCWDEPVMPVRCHIRLRKSRVLHATNDSMWNAGKGLAWLFLLLSAMSTYVDEQNCTGSCSSCSIRRWMMAVSMWKRCLDCLHVSDLMVTVPCLPHGSHSFHCCLLVSGKHLSGMEASPEYNHEWCVRAWMRMWIYSAYNDTACVESGKDSVCCVNRKYFPCIWERIMKHDVREPFRTIHGCIRWERNLGTGHDAIPWSFPEWFVLDSDAVCLAVSMSFVSGSPPPQTIGMDASQGKEWSGNRMTSRNRKPQGWRYGFGLGCTHCQHGGRCGCVRRGGWLMLLVASVMFTVGMRWACWWTLAGRWLSFGFCWLSFSSWCSTSPACMCACRHWHELLMTRGSSSDTADSGETTCDGEEDTTEIKRCLDVNQSWRSLPSLVVSGLAHAW